MNHFDKRTVELLLKRAEKFPPPSHLGDLGVAEVMETFGRERRHRYFTVAHYRDLVAQENLDENNTRYADPKIDGVGGFMKMDESSFYSTPEELRSITENTREDLQAKAGKPVKRRNPPGKVGRPKKEVVLDEHGEPITPSKAKYTKRKRATDGDAADGDAESKPKPAKKPRMTKKQKEALAAKEKAEAEAAASAGPSTIEPTPAASSLPTPSASAGPSRSQTIPPTPVGGNETPNGIKRKLSPRYSSPESHLPPSKRVRPPEEPASVQVPMQVDDSAIDPALRSTSETVSTYI